MAIRPADLQTVLIASTQTPPTQQRAEDAPRVSQGAAQAQFVAQTEQRNERVAESGDAKGNRIELKDREQERQQGQGRRRQRRPGDPFEEVVDEAAGLTDGTPHLIDYTA